MIERDYVERRASTAPSSFVEIDAWIAGRRVTHDGTLDCLADVLRHAGIRNGSFVATHMPGPKVYHFLSGELLEVDADYEYAKRGHAPASCETVMPYLDEAARDLVSTGSILIVDRMSEEVPEHVARGFRASGISRGVACCHLRDDGQIMVIVDIGPLCPIVLRHEMIHAAQCVVSTRDLEDALGAAAAQGGSLGTTLLGQSEGNADLDWIMDVCRRAASARREPEILSSFELALAIFPRPETMAIASANGFEDRNGVVAALFAHAASVTGLNLDPSSNVAREMVAYCFQANGDAAYHSLMQAAVAACRTTPSNVPVASR